MSTIDQEMTQKLAALRGISRHLGYTGRRNLSLASGQVDIEFALHMVAGAVTGLVAPNRQWWQRAACAAILDILSPGWREDADAEILGLIVERYSPEVRRWREAVLSRDGYCCRHCGSLERLHVHHILRWADVPEARVVTDNVLTLCERCHIAEHHGSRDASQTDTDCSSETDR